MGVKVAFFLERIKQFHVIQQFHVKLNATPAFGEPRHLCGAKFLFRVIFEHLIESSDINVILLKTRHIFDYSLKVQVKLVYLVVIKDIIETL